jgi:hypothetical protein
MVAIPKQGEGKVLKRREPPPGNGGPQNIGLGFYEPQAACRLPTTPPRD